MSEFHKKHIGPSQKEIDEMLQYLDCNSLNDLLEKIVPKIAQKKFARVLPCKSKMLPEGNPEG